MCQSTLRMIQRFLLFAGILGAQSLWAQTPRLQLLEDAMLQIEATEAMNAMYNFQFEQAEAAFTTLKNKYQGHPLPFLLLGLNTWWKIVPEMEDSTHDKTFIAYMDTATHLAKRLYKKDKNNYEATFFLAAAHAFKGYLYGEKNYWIKAAVAGKEALKYLELTKKKKHLGAELLFGDALYNYYSAWIYENYPSLRFLKSLFKVGKKESGIAQLRAVARNAFYTRTEAQYFLLRILTDEEEKYEEALELAGYLTKTFPNNPVFERYYAKLLYITGKFTEAEQVALRVVEKVDQEIAGYGPTTGRYAGFFLGYIYTWQNKIDLAKYFYHKSKKWAEAANAITAGYYFHTLLALGHIAQQEDSTQLARGYYRKVKKTSKRKGKVHQQAKKRLSQLSRKQSKK